MFFLKHLGVAAIVRLSSVQGLLAGCRYFCSISPDSQTLLCRKLSTPVFILSCPV